MNKSMAKVIGLLAAFYFSTTPIPYAGAQTKPDATLQLTIAATATQNVQLSWPKAAGDSVLEQTDSLTPPVVWKTVDQSITVAGNWNTLKVANGGAMRFYRLRTVPNLVQLLTDHIKHLAVDLPVMVSITNAYPEIPFLDDFQPNLLAPLARVPRGMDGDLILLPGLWQAELESYCLKTGTMGPTAGDGYLPLAYAGPRADLIQKILQGVTVNPLIPQESAQILLWAIMLRTPLDVLPPPVQAIAHQLLSTQDWQRLETAVQAMAQLQDDYADRVVEAILGPNGLFKDLPPDLRQQLLKANQLEEELRNNLNLSYESIQGYAFSTDALMELPTTSREIPRGRWAWFPASATAPYGYLVRYLPYFYDVTLVQFCVPEDLAIEADDLGRITAIEDGQGHRIETLYDDTISPLSFTGDTGVKGYAFRRIKLVGPADPEDPRRLLAAQREGLGWTLLGVPAGNGAPSGNSSGRYVNADKRYPWAVARVEEFNHLNNDLTRVHPNRRSATPGLMANLVNLAHYCEALRQALTGAFPEEDPQSVFLPDRLGLAYRAWISQLTGFCVGAPGTAQLGLSTRRPEDGQPDAPGLATLQRSSSGNVRGFSFDSLFFWQKPKPKPRPVTDSWYEHCDNLFHGVPDTYVHAGSYGTQNLGVSGRKTAATQQEARLAYENAQKTSGQFTYAVDKGHSLMGVPTPWQAPLEFVKVIIDGTVKLFYYAGSVLAGIDPPRDDFTVVAAPKIVDPGPVNPGPEVSLQRLAAARTFLAADLRLAAYLHAAVVSLERQAGAVRAGQGRWAAIQAGAVVHYQREAAVAMLDTADALERWLQVLAEEGVEDIWEEKAELLATKARFRSGFAADEIAALRQLGLADSEIERCRQGLIAFPIEAEDVLGAFDTATWLFESLREAGRQLMALPVITLPPGL